MSFFFRVYSPQGQLITPTTPGYRVFMQGAARHTRTVEPEYGVSAPSAAKPATGWWEWSSGKSSPVFYLAIAHGRDTMRVIASSGGRGFVLDSIPYRPGTYRLSGEAYLAGELLREVRPAARLRPGVWADWQYLLQPRPLPLPQVVAELIEVFPNAARELDRSDTGGCWEPGQPSHSRRLARFCCRW
ncbi:MAG: hypothetical protein ACRYFX_08415 [Janthinobacterium lividum]